jgi:hypothetical protein
MNKKTIISILFFVTFIIIFVSWNNGALDSKKFKISDDVFLVQNNPEDYSIYCNKELIASSVDSIILTPRYGTMLYGIGEQKTSKEWHYIDASPVLTPIKQE